MKQYTIQHYDLYWDCKISIDEKKAKQKIKEMVEFWANWERNLKDNNGDYIATFVKQLAQKIFYIVIAENYNKTGVINWFSTAEGWCEMDGSHGIVIESVDDFEFEQDDFGIIFTEEI